MGEIFLVFGLLCIFSCRVHLGKEWNRDYLSIDQTQFIKGIFICIVFFSHIHQYFTYTSFRDELVQKFTGFLGQTMVAPFLFYSGYGVMESIRKKGKAYIALIPWKRILSTLFLFDCAVLLYVVEELWRGKIYPWYHYLAAFVGWEHIENSNWYIFAILMLYGITYIAFTLFNDHRKAVALCFGMTCLWMICMDYWQIKGIWYYDTMLCYTLGMVFSLCKGPVEKFLGEKRLIYLLVVVMLAAAFVVLQPYEYQVVGSSVRTCLFALLVVCVTMRLRLKSRLLHWCGAHLFSLYILQRLPMVVMRHLGWNQNVALGCIGCIVVTVLLTIPFEYVTGKLWKKLAGNQ